MVSSRVLLFALAAALLALAFAGPARARVLQQGGNNPAGPPSPPRPAPPPPVPLPPKKPSQMARSWYPQQQQPQQQGRYWYPPQGRGGWMPSGYPGAREGPGRGYAEEGEAVDSGYEADPYADAYSNNNAENNGADYYGGGEQTPYYDGGGYEENSNAYPAPMPPSRANTPDGRWLPCWLFHDIEAAIAWGLVDPTQCWPHSPSPSPVPPPSPLPPPPSPLPSVSPIPPPPSPSPPPPPSPLPEPSPAPPQPSPSPSPQPPPSPSPFPPFSPIPPPPNPRPPTGKVTCIPGDVCRTAKYACELDAICDQWGQCPPSAPVAREDSFVCREAAGECDQDEYCDGVSYTCGPDAFLPAGTPCTDINGNDSQCWGGKPEKADDPYSAPRAGPKGFYKEPPNRWPKGLLRLRRRVLGAKDEQVPAPRLPRAAAAQALVPSSSSPSSPSSSSSSSARPLSSSSSRAAAVPPFVVVDYASSAEAGARRYKYNPRVCPLAAYGSDDDDDGGGVGGRKGDKRGRK